MISFVGRKCQATTVLLCSHSRFELIFTSTPLFNILYFMAVKIDRFQIKNCEIFIIFARNMDCGYVLEPPHLDGSNEYPQSMF